MTVKHERYLDVDTYGKPAKNRPGDEAIMSEKYAVILAKNRPKDEAKLMKASFN